MIVVVHGRVSRSGSVHRPVAGAFDLCGTQHCAALPIGRLLELTVMPTAIKSGR
jgi:hypothetical protein